MAAKFVIVLAVAALGSCSVIPLAKTETDYTSFAYDVADPNTGDFKSQVETRVGGTVSGQYSLLDADGTRRVVDYAADDVNGFNAVVRKDPAVVAAAPIIAPAPVVAAAPTVVEARLAEPIVAAAPLAVTRTVETPVLAKTVAAPVVTYAAAAPSVYTATAPVVASRLSAPVVAHSVAAPVFARSYYGAAPYTYGHAAPLATYW